MLNDSSSFIELSNSVTYKKYTDEEKQKHREDWKSSGLSMTDYCRKIGLAVSTLSKWLKEPDLKMVTEEFPQDNVVAAASNQNQPGIEIILVSGLRLRLGRANMSEVIRLIRAIQSCN